VGGLKGIGTASIDARTGVNITINGAGNKISPGTMIQLFLYIVAIWRPRLLMA
jgi:hypothetical protein